MTAASQLIDFLSSGPASGAVGVAGWRFEVADAEAVRAGIRDSQLGGPYEGPGVALRLGGSLELQWADGTLSRVTLDRSAVLDPRRELAAWRQAAVSPRYGALPPLAGPTPMPAVETFDADLARAVTDDPSSILDLLQRLRDGARGGGAERVDGVVRVSAGVRTVATSRGLRATWQETACGITLWADELGASAFERRALPSSERVGRLATDAAALARQMRQSQALPDRPGGVLFMPAAVDALLGRFLLPNLIGRAIRDGRSPFTEGDLMARRQIVREDVDLVVDTTVPFELATSPYSPEGVPAGRVALIERGRLASPLLDLETAATFNLAPTPVPRGQPRVLLISTAGAISLEAALATLGHGVVVRELPGLHTQPTRRASYAVVAPDAQVVSDGAVGGRCAVRLAGNLIDHVSQPTTRLICITGEAGVGMLVVAGVETLAA